MSNKQQEQQQNTYILAPLKCRLETALLHHGHLFARFTGMRGSEERGQGFLTGHF